MHKEIKFLSLWSILLEYKPNNGFFVLIPTAILFNESGWIDLTITWLCFGISVRRYKEKN